MAKTLAKSEVLVVVARYGEATRKARDLRNTKFCVLNGHGPPRSGSLLTTIMSVIIILWPSFYVHIRKLHCTKNLSRSQSPARVHRFLRVFICYKGIDKGL